MAQHPDIDVHLELAAATVQPPTVWVVETRDVDTLTEILKRGEKVVLGPRAADALQRADLLGLVREREGKTGRRRSGRRRGRRVRQRDGETIVITRDTDLAALGVGATVIQLTDQIITTCHPDALEPGEIDRDYQDPVVPLGQVQGIEAVIAGLCAVSVHYMALAFVADRMQHLKAQWPVSAANLTRPIPRPGPGRR